MNIHMYIFHLYKKKYNLKKLFFLLTNKSQSFFHNSCILDWRVLFEEFHIHIHLSPFTIQKLRTRPSPATSPGRLACCWALYSDITDSAPQGNGINIQLLVLREANSHLCLRVFCSRLPILSVHWIT